MISGILLRIPFVVTLLVLRLAVGTISSLMSPLIGMFAPYGIPRPLITLLSIILLFVIVYFTGAVATYTIGKHLLSLAESVFLRIPLLKTVYSSTKTAISALSFTQRASFRSVVLIQFPKDGFWSIGFVTGTSVSASGQEFLKIFIPTTPNPTTGFFELVRKSDVLQTDLSVEDGIQTIVSGGILFPSVIPEIINSSVSENTCTVTQDSHPGHSHDHPLRSRS